MACVINYKNNTYSLEDFKNVLLQDTSLLKEITKKSQERLNAIQEIFNQNPELSKIGDVFSYALYLDTIFPQSVVKDIVYHGVVKGRDAYNNILEKGFDFKTSRNWDSKNSKLKENDNTGMFFSDYSTGQSYGLELTYKINEKGEYEDVGYNNVIPVILNIEYLDNSKETSSGTAASFYKENKDRKNIGMFGPEGGSEGVHDNYVVFEPEQIHILGSKQDIEGFKSWIDEFNRSKYLQLSSNLVNPAIEELDNYLLDFLKSFNVKTKSFEELKSRLGVNALGATDVLNKLIWYVKNRNEETLPEESAHMLVALMGENHPDIKELLTNISNWSEYNDIKKEYLPIYKDENKVKIEAVGKLIAKSLVKNYKVNGLDKNLLQKALDNILNFIEDILNSMNISNIFRYNEFVADHIAINVLSGNKDYIYKIKNLNPNLNAEKEINNNPNAKGIINNFSSGNVKMTGSLAIAGTENIRRPEGQGIHDIDFKVKSFEVFNKEVLPKIPDNAVPAHYGWHKKSYSTFAYYIPIEGYRINVLERKDNFSNGWITNYKLYNEKNEEVEITQSNVMSVDFFVYKEGENQKDFDFSSEFIPASLVYEGKMSLGGKSNPYFFSRDKDQEDYVLRNPKSFIPFEKHIYYQLDDNTTSNTTSNGVKPGVEELFDSNPELANQVYEALGFDKTLEFYEGDNLKIDDKTYTISEKISSKELAKRNGLTISSNVPVYIVNEPLGLRKGGYDTVNNIIILSKNSDKETIHHELIHSVEYNLDKKEIEPLYQKVKNTITEDSFNDFVSWNFKKSISEFIADALSKKVFRDALKKEGLLEEIDNILSVYNQQITPQQKQQALQLYSQYLESLNKPNTNPILQGNQQEQVKKFAELQERLNNKEFLEGAKNAFESSEELQNVYYEALGFTGMDINPRKNYLLSKEYKNFGWLSEKEKTDYLNLQNNSKDREEREKAYIKLRELYKEKVDKDFIDNVEKVHWFNSVESLSSLLENGKTIPFEISTEGYYNEEFKSGWGNGIGIKLKGETVIASNEDLRSDNKYGSIKDGNFRKYSYGDSTSIILKKEDFLKHKDLTYTTSKGDIKQGHNEFLLKNSEIEAIVIDKTNPKLKDIDIAKILKIADKYSITIMYSDEIKTSQTTPQQKQDALNAYNDYIARVSLGIIKNPSSGEYNYYSKVKDIVYHGTDTKFDKFNKTILNKIRGKSKTEFIHFTNSFDLAMDYSAQALGYADAADMYKKAPEKMDNLMQVLPALINGNKINNENVEYGNKFELEQKNIFVENTIFKFGYDLAVFEPEQIHILGSKQDVEGFKKFILNINFQEEINELNLPSKINQFYTDLTQEKKNKIGDIEKLYNEQTFPMEETEFINMLKCKI
jgi:hypothetical protein